MNVACPHCRTQLEVAEAHRGRSVVCTVCRTVFVAPGDVEAHAPQPAPAPGPWATPPPAPPPMPPGFPFFVSPMTRAKWAVGFAVAAILLGLACGGSSLLQLDLLNRVAEGGVTPEEAEQNDLREAVVAGLSGATTITAIVLYLVWKYRAYKNLRPLGAGQVRFSPGGSVGWYFCPILNLWKPCQAMTDIWLGSRERSPLSYASSAGGFVLFWWLVWLADQTLGYIVFRAVMRTARMEEPPLELLISNTRMEIAAEVVSMVSWVLTVALIWVVSTRQVARRRELGPAAA